MKHRILILSVLTFSFILLTLLNNGERQTQSINFTLPKIETLDTIKVNRTGQEEVILALGPNWTCNGPNWPCDLEALTALREAMTNMIGMDYEIAGGEQPRRYGISEHSIIVSLISGEKAVRRFKVGKVIDGERTFIQDTTSQKIYRAKANLRRVFDRERIAWNQRQIFGESFDQIKSVSRVNNQKTGVLWQFSRSSANSSWSVVTPLGVEFGLDEMNAIANVMATLTASDFSSPADFRKSFELSAETFSGRTLRLEVGEMENDESRLIRLDQSRVARIPRHQAIFLDANINDLRNRRVFDFSASVVNEVDLIGKESIKLKKSSPVGAQAAWFIRTEGQTSEVASPIVDRFLSVFTQLKLSGFLAPHQFGDTVKDEVKVVLVGGESVTLQLGERYGAGRAARLVSKQDHVFALSKRAISLLQSDSRAFSTTQTQD